MPRQGLKVEDVITRNTPTSIKFTAADKQVLTTIFELAPELRELSMIEFLRVMLGHTQAFIVAKNELLQNQLNSED